MKKKWITGLAAFACAVLGALCLTACDESGTGEQGQGQEQQGYTVTFTVDGKTYRTVVSDGYQIVLPSVEPEKEGYIFDGWDYDPSVPLTEDTVITAKWRPNPETGYVIEHLVKDPESGDWRFEGHDWFCGETDSEVTAEPLNPDYYIFREDLSTPTGIIRADGGLCLQMYYELKTFTVTFDGNGGTLVSGEATQEVPYGYKATAPVFEKEGHSYTFDKEFYSVEENMTVTANWTVNKYALRFNLDNGARGPEFYQDYGTPIDVSQIEEPTKLGYKFVGWDKEIPATMNEGGEIVAQYEPLPEMASFDFYSWGDTCKINGVSDTTATSLVIPEYVTEIEKGALKACTSLESITLPFLGLTPDSTNEEGHLGAIFGWVSYGSTSGDYHYVSSKGYKYYIPETLTTVRLTGGQVKPYAFRNCKNLETVTLPSGVTGIDQEAFYGCEKITRMEVPDGATRVNGRAFKGCTGLTEIVLPESLTVIGSGAFYGCKNLSEITLGENLEAIASSAFEGCGGLKTLTIPDSVTSLDGYAFKECSGLTEVYIGKGVTSYGTGVFMWCSGLEKLTIPSVEFAITGEVKRYIGYLFGASAATSNQLPAKTVELYDATYIPAQAFYNCTALESVVFPDGVTSIGASAFEGCSALTGFEIPQNIESIGASAFKGCSSLPEIALPLSITEIGASMFEGCSSLTEFAVHEKITSVSENAFKDCSGLKTLLWGNNVESVGAGAFENCTALTTVRIADLGAWYVIDFADATANPMNGGGKLYLLADLITRLTVPDTVTEIKPYAFYNCEQLSDVEIPTHVTKIAVGAFAKCNGLTNITVPFLGTHVKAWKYETVFGAIFGYEARNSDIYTGDGAVYQYYDGGSSKPYYHYYIPESLKTVSVIGGESIPENAFYNSKVQEVTVGDGVKTIGWNAFGNCQKLTKVTLPSGVETIESHAFHECTALQTLNIPNSLQTLGTSVFLDCDSLIYNEAGGVYYLGDDENPYVVAVSSEESMTECVIKDGTKIIADRAFYYCLYLTTATIPGTVERIGDNAFAHCGLLTTVEIADGVKEIGAHAFYYCGNLTEVVLPDSVEKIGGDAFRSSSLTSFTAPNGVTAIESSTFSDCYALQSVVLHDGITRVSENAFDGCTSLAFTEYENGCYLGTADNPYYLLVKVSSTELTEFTMHAQTVIAIDYLFQDCTTLTKATLGENLRYIGYGMFSGCTALTSITVPDSVVSIERSAFSGCGGLASIVIGEKVTVIGEYNAYNVNNLTTVYYKGTAEDWENIQFSGFNSAIVNAQRYYYSEETPTDGGNYWHYADDGETVVIWE